MAAEEKKTVWIGIAGLVLGLVTLGWTMYAGRVPLTVSVESQFICSLRSNPNSTTAQQIWTVLYERPGKQPKEWLYMVEEMGDGWNTESRCRDISDRMNIYKEAGLLSFEYRPDENTPKQWVICARTKVTQGCPPVVTLVPGDEAEAMAALQRVAGALMPGNPGSYQSSAEITLEQPASIPLAGVLAED
ncbi:COP23 domain-containing protein [Spirulina major CS-329]|uniref:COP23 domain-containing protein n=1 Tax=Spirulina TaxID=1154 RepID=UPI00232B450C|nr:MULTISPECIES: COP23 domain-containing protein [Spirulina]MDB9493891.1 COP23 domain-containing protein [Spirulina subsalsa CS-330]MDB9504577.1 COP23 domain-containing protein [Spirulina major CS-329]